jgi:hypothetical protein
MSEFTRLRNAAFLAGRVLHDKSPFHGDKDGASQILFDAISVAQKDYKGACMHCGGDVKQNTCYRRMVAIWDGFWYTKICQPCCAAYAIQEVDGGELVEARMCLRWSRR